MRRPSIKNLPAPWREAAHAAATRLAERGYRAWLVGGAVRDLALGSTPKDADLTSAASPEIVEGLFERTHAVGAAFGTVGVHLGGVELEVTTFRSEGDYRDARRPSSVRWGESVAEDAERRDFTANALYLDPLTDEVADPTGGLADMEARLLRCVGDPAERFAEDGLRILRMARFAARFDWHVEETTLQAAALSLEALRGVSVERVLAELETIAKAARPGRAVRLLQECGALLRVLPELAGREPSWEERCAAVEQLADMPGAVRFLAVLLHPHGSAARKDALAVAERLRVSRALARALQSTWELEDELVVALREARSAEPARARLLRLVRRLELGDAASVLRAWRRLEADEDARLAEWERMATELGDDVLRPKPLVTGADLEQAGLEPGPIFAEILREAEDLRLDGSHGTRAAALSWLAERLREGPAAQDGGKTRRKA